jgi:hypothetical protein
MLQSTASAAREPFVDLPAVKDEGAMNVLVSALPPLTDMPRQAY